jgi:hypothetical protein
MNALEKLQECYPQAPKQSAIGHIPATYICAAATLCTHPAIRECAADIQAKQNHKLRQPLDRDTLRDLCRSDKVDPMVAFCCCMAWGVQWSTPSGFDNFCQMIRDPKLAHNLSLLRNPARIEGEKNGSDRRKAFVLFDDNDLGVENLGRSYFTKLIFFFLRQREGQGTGYIQDRWTEKAYQRLSPCCPEFQAQARRGDGAAGRYEDFCRFIYHLAKIQNWSGSETEVALFGAAKGSDGAYLWRSFLNKQ